MRHRDKGHPDLLPWLAAGRLEAADIRQVEDHVRGCEECAEVAASLTSMSRSLRSAAMEHIGVEELIDWEEGRIHGDAERSARIETHLAVCTTCTEDLTTLRQTRPRSQSREGPSRWWLVAAAAAIVLGASLSIISSLRERPEPESIVLLPVTRSGESAPAIDGTRPWTIVCVLPFSAPSGEYRVWIERDDGSLLRPLDGTFRPDADARISFVLEPIAQAGDYRLMLEPVEGPAGTSYSYRIRVQS